MPLVWFLLVPFLTITLKQLHVSVYWSQIYVSQGGFCLFQGPLGHPGPPGEPGAQGPKVIKMLKWGKHI